MKLGNDEWGVRMFIVGAWSKGGWGESRRWGGVRMV